MKPFFYFILTIIFFVLAILGFTQFLDPGTKLNLNTGNVIAGSILVILTIYSLYMFLITLFHQSNSYIYHHIRGVLIGVFLGGILVLKVFSILNWPILGIISCIYVLCEFFIFELQK
jgi:hypothetical protein